MNFNEEQKTAIYSNKPFVVISAGAGSGKTRVLTERYVYLCEQKLQEKLGYECSAVAASIEEIVAITFTEKAAREMKERIRSRIEQIHTDVPTLYDSKDQELASKYWQVQKEALDGAFITTFHSFCHKLLHEYAFEADITPNFTVLDDVQVKLIQLEIFTEMFDSPENYSKWRPLYNFYTQNQLSEALKAVYSQLKENITSVASIEAFFDCDEILTLQLASVEADRKMVLTNFYREAKAYVMVLDETEKAQKKIIDHFQTIGNLSFENPEGVYQELLEAMPKRISNAWQESQPQLFELYEYLFKPLKETWKNFRVLTKEELAELKEIMELFVDMLIIYDEKYEAVKRDRAAFDFSDLQQKAIALLENEQVQQACRRKYKHMMIDEFQDTNQLQMNMLTFIQPDYKFVVGDGKQSIYRFRGADVSLIKQLVDFSKYDRTSDFVNMSTNYRTCASIIQFVNEAFSEIMGSEEKNADQPYKINYNTIKSHRNNKEEQKGRVELLTIPSENEQEEIMNDQEGNHSEYEMVVNRMLGMIAEKQPLVAENDQWRAPTWSDFAILIQARTKLTKLEKALKDKRIPYVVYGGIGFYEKQEIRDMLLLLQWLNRPWEPLYILALLRSPLFGVSVEDFLTLNECLEAEISLADFIYEGLFEHEARINPTLKMSLTKLKQFFEKWVPYTPQTSIRDYLEELFTDSGLKMMLLLQRNNLQLIKNVEKLLDIIAEFHSSSLDDLLNHLKQLAALSDKEGEAEVELAEGNVVHIMTVHASKGLEFPIVFLPNLAKGPRGDSGSIRFDHDVRLALQYMKEIDPLKKPEEKASPAFHMIKARAKDQAIEEAKRLFYVAVTRARDYLVLASEEKAANHSWYDMLLKAFEQNNSLRNYVQEYSEVPELQSWENSGDYYEPPKLNPRKLVKESFSVSEIMTFINDPVKYYDKYIIKLEDEWLFDQNRGFQDNDQPLSSATLGTIVHRACELLDNGYDLTEAKQEALTMIDDELEKITYQAAMDELIDNYCYLEELELGTTVATEWPFVMELDGVEIIGEIDKIVEKDGFYHLIDIKTNNSDDYVSLISYYTPQLYLYKMAFEKVYQQKVSQLSLFFIRAKKAGFKTIPFSSETCLQLEEIIRKMVFLKRTNAPRTAYQVEKNQLVTKV